MVCDWEPIDALTRLLILTDGERELWVDNRMRLSLDRLAVREGVTPQAISLRLQKIDRNLAGPHAVAA